jgi:hypothetical protein
MRWQRAADTQVRVCVPRGLHPTEVATMRWQRAADTQVRVCVPRGSIQRRDLQRCKSCES